MLYKKVLVPVSLEQDRNTTAALEIAQAIREKDGEITLLHVMESLPKYATEYLPEDYIEKSRKAIEDDLAKIGADLSNVNVRVVTGHSGRTILEFAEKEGKDCIVIASHRPGLQDYFLGSTAARVVRHATCAVHVVR